MDLFDLTVSLKQPQNISILNKVLLLCSYLAITNMLSRL